MSSTPPPPPPPSPASQGVDGAGPPSNSLGYSSLISELVARWSGGSVSFTRPAGTPATDTTIVTRPAGLLDTAAAATTPPDQRVTPAEAAAPKKTPLATELAQGLRVMGGGSPPGAHRTPGTGHSTNKTAGGWTGRYS